MAQKGFRVVEARSVEESLYLSSGFSNLVEIVVGGGLSPILYLEITIPTQIYTDGSPIKLLLPF